MKNFRAYQLALVFRAEAMSLPLKGAIRDQMERASLSVVLNLAEGSAKRGVKDRRRFFLMALGSVREVQAIIDVMAAKHLKERASHLGASVYKLCKNPGDGNIS